MSFSGMTEREQIARLKADLAAEREAHARARAVADAAEREADRLRHGVAVEGDHVCPAELERDAAIARAERAERQCASWEAGDIAKLRALCLVSVALDEDVSSQGGVTLLDVHERVRTMREDRDLAVARLANANERETSYARAATTERAAREKAEAALAALRADIGYPEPIIGIDSWVSGPTHAATTARLDTMTRDYAECRNAMATAINASTATRRGLTRWSTLASRLLAAVDVDPAREDGGTDDEAVATVEAVVERWRAIETAGIAALLDLEDRQSDAGPGEPSPVDLLISALRAALDAKVGP